MLTVINIFTYEFCSLAELTAMRAERRTDASALVQWRD
jgi:hypothetical protein